MSLFWNLMWFLVACAGLGVLALGIGWVVDYYDKKDRMDPNRIDL